MCDLKKYEITVFGDSISKGIVTDNNGNITRLHDGIVNIIENHYDIHINNISFYGQTLKKIYNRGIFERYIQDSKLKTNCVAVLFIGGNDSDYDWKDVANSPREFHESNSSLEEFSYMYSDIIVKMKQAGIFVITITIPPIDSKRYFENVISKITDKQQVLEFFNGDITNINRHQECFNIAILKCSAKNEVMCFDLRTPLLIKSKVCDYLCNDGIHPNEKGHKLMADTLIGYLEDMLFESQKTSVK